MSEDKRKRSPNWLLSEKSILLELIEYHYGIIENKKTDGATLKQKSAKWQKIANKFNSQTVMMARSAENLKAQWENLKKVTRKEESNKRLYMNKTGGGPPIAKKEDPLHERVIRLIKTSAIGLYNPYDSDHSQVPVVLETNEILKSNQDEPEIIVEIHNLNEIEQEKGKNNVTNEVIGNLDPLPLSEQTDHCLMSKVDDEIEKDWGDYNPKLLRTPMSKALSNKKYLSRRRPYLQNKSRVDTTSLEQAKIKELIAQGKRAEEEHKIEMANKKEKHRIEMAIKEQQLLYEKKKMDLLDLEIKQKQKE